MRLSTATLRRVPGGVARFAHDRASQATGIVHFGIGAFHRAHQAWYTDLAMDAGDRDWMMTGVSLRSPAVKAQLEPQDGLFTVTERSGACARTRVVGSVREVLVADRDAARIVAAIAAPECRIVSFTVTEKGYARTAAGALDHHRAGQGFYPLLAEGLARRRAAGLPGLTLLSCDNLPANGQVLGALVHDHLAARSRDLATWFAENCTCPSTMVDRIVPATTPFDRDAVQHALGGLRDEGAVMTEPFSQWVIEDRFAAGRPAWDAAGAQFVADVAPFETAKLRMLNGAHSALAYLGLAAGHAFVHEAVADPAIRRVVERLMRDEALPTIAPAPGQDLAAYADALLHRFANEALGHRLAQIAIDGSQKIEQRWLATLAERRGQASPAIIAALAAWLRHTRGENGPVDDPLADRMAALWSGSDPRAAIGQLFGPGGLVSSSWQPDDGELAVLVRALMA